MQKLVTEKKREREGFRKSSVRKRKPTVSTERRGLLRGKHMLMNMDMKTNNESNSGNTNEWWGEHS